MITDIKNTFATELASVGASAQVGDIIDLGADYDAAVGNPIEAHIVVTTGYTGGTSQNFQVRTCAAEGGTYVEVGAVGPIVTAGLTKGTHKKIGLQNLKRYVQLYRVASGTATAGAVSGWIAQR